MSEEEFYNKLKYNFFGTKDSEDFKELVKAYNDKSKKLELYKSIIKEVREIVKHEKDELDEFKGVDLLINTYQQVFGIMLEILDKVEENK